MIKPNSNCIRCGKLFYSPPPKKGVKYCSWECRQGGKTLEERFWQKVKIGNPDDCWKWTGNLDGKNYGRIMFKKYGKRFLAHRLSWYIHNGKIPQGLFVCHHCDNPTCVNPKHLFLGTPTDNMKDMYDKNRHIRVSMKGSENPMAKLTKEQVTKIREEYDYRRGAYERLGKIYNVSSATIRAIILRINWNHT